MESFKGYVTFLDLTFQDQGKQKRGFTHIFLFCQGPVRFVFMSFNTSLVAVVFVSLGIFIFYCLFGLNQQLNRNDHR